MSFCPGCLPTGRALAELYETVRQKATEFGKINQKDMAIYRTVEGYEFIDATTAINNNYPIKEIISYSV